MSQRPKLVTIFGGSGFVGRYIARRMAKNGWRVRVAVRRPNEAHFVRPYGVVGQVEPVFANVRDDESTRAAIEGADAVVNCVGILAEDSRQKFDTVQSEAAGRIARIAASLGVERLVHLSAIGADATAQSQYAQSKAEGEALVQKHFKSAVILRPSIIFGTEDQFFNRFAKMAKVSPVIPLVGGKTKFQPVFVDDVAQAAEVAILGQAKPGIYELGGPEVASFEDLVGKMLGIIRRRRLVVNLPFWLGRLQGRIFDILQAASLGLFKNTILTRDQVLQLANDNVVGDKARGFKALRIEPTAMDAVLEDYLYVHRPYGQYTALTESADHLSSKG